MPTPSERKALAFVGTILLLAGAVRVVRGGPMDAPLATRAEQQALARQAAAASSASVSQREQRARRSVRLRPAAPKRRHGGARFDSTGVLIEGTGVLNPSGFPPPLARIDVDLRARDASRGAPFGKPEHSGTGGPGVLIDLDVATATEIERLPGLGPALARRIVASRDSLGPFGILSAVARVRGVGPATLQRLAPLVTFSGQARR